MGGRLKRGVRIFAWILGWTLFAAAVSWSLVLALVFTAVGYPLLVGALTFGLLITFLFKRRSLPPVTFLGQLAFVVACPIYVVAVTLPLRLASILVAPVPHLSVFDAAAAAAAVFVTLLVTARDALWRVRQLRQLENLPTSRAAAAAVGLVELRGTALPAVGEAKPGDILFRGKPEPFVLEDAGGRIRIDPRGARVRRFWSHALGGRACEVVLPEATLKCGDPVYVIGSAEADPEVPGQRVVRPRVEARTSFLWRTFLTFKDRSPEPRRDIQHVFFVSGHDESAARSHILNGLRQILVLAGIWLASAAVLAAVQLPRALSYDTWSVAELVQHAPDGPGLAALGRRYREGDPATRLEVARRIRPYPRSVERDVLLLSLLGDPDAEVARTGADRLISAWADGRGSYAQWVGPAHAAAAPALLRALQGPAVEGRRNGAGFLAVVAPEDARRALPALLADAAPIVRRQAASGLAEAKARGAVPELLRALGDPEPDVNGALLNALESILREDPDFLPTFQTLLDHAHPFVRAGALRVLMSRGDRAALADVLRRLEDPDPKVRYEAVRAAAHLGASESALLGRVDDAVLFVRVAAVEALGSLRPPRDAVLPLLVRLLEDPQEGVVERAADALRSFGPRADVAAARLARLLVRPDGAGSAAARTLAALGPAAGPVLDRIEAALGHPDPKVRARVAELVGKLGPVAARLAAALGLLVEDADYLVRGGAARALAALKADAAPAVPRLARALRSGSPADAGEILRTLTELGPAAEAAVPALIERARLDDSHRNAAIRTLGRIGPAAKAALPALLELTTGGARWEALEALQKIGPGDPAFAEILRERLRQAPRPEREPYALLLCRYGEAAVPSIPEIVDLMDDGFTDTYLAAVADLGAPAATFVQHRLRDPNRRRRYVALRILEQMGPRAASAASALEAVVRDRAHPDRRHAASVLGKLGPAARPAVPALIGLLPERELDVVAVDALGQIGPAALEAVPALARMRRDIQDGNWPGLSSALGRIVGIPDARGPDLDAAALEALRAGDADDARRAALAAIVLRARLPAIVSGGLEALAKRPLPVDQALDLLRLVVRDTAHGRRREILKTYAALERERRVATELALVILADAKDAYGRLDALGLLLATGPTPEAAEALGALLDDADVRVRVQAAEALGRVDAPRGRHVPRLAALLKENYGETWRIALALGRLGPAGAPAIPALEEAAKRGDELLRAAATEALNRLRSQEATGERELFREKDVDVLRRALREPRRELAAVQRFEERDPATPEAVPELAAALEDPSLLVRVLAARALANAGPAAASAVPALAKAVGDPSPAAAGAAARALAAVGPAATPAFDALLAAYRRGRDEAAAAFAALGPAAAEAVPDLVKSVETYPNTAAIEALGRIGAAAAPAVPALTRILEHKSVYIRVAAADALGGIGPAAAEAVPALVRRLGAPIDGWDEGRRAAGGLAGIGEAAVPALIDALEDRNERTSARAAEALGGMGPRAKAAVPALMEHVRRQSLGWKLSGVQALGKIGPDAREAVPLLKTIAAGDSNVAGEARRAIARIQAEPR